MQGYDSFENGASQKSSCSKEIDAPKDVFKQSL